MASNKKSPRRDFFLVYEYRLEVLVEQRLRSVELLGRILLHALQLILLSHSLVLVYSEGMVGQYLDSLHHLELAQVLAQRANIRLGIAIARHKHIAQPEWLAIALEPLRSTESLLVATLGQKLMLRRVVLLDIEQHQVDNRE